MAMTIVWDLVSDAEVQVTRQNGCRIVRKGLIKGITSSATTTRKALMDAVRQAITSAEIKLPEYPGAFIDYVNVRSVGPQSPTMAHIWAGYSTPEFGGAPVEKFSIEGGIELQSEPTNFMPGTRTPLLASIDNTTPIAAGGKTKVVSANYPAELESLVLSGLFANGPTANMFAAARCVNMSNFPNGTRSKPKGYWRCGGVRYRWSSRDGLWAVVVPFVSKVEEDWTTYEYVRDSFGEFVDTVAAKTWLASNYGAPYTHDTTPRYQSNGLFVAGLYRTAEFNAIFSPLIDNTPIDHSPTGGLQSNFDTFLGHP